MKKTNFIIHLIFYLAIIIAPCIIFRSEASVNVYAADNNCYGYGSVLSPTPTPRLTTHQQEMEDIIKDLESHDSGIFKSLEDALINTTSGAYSIIKYVGLIVLVLCLTLAILFLGILKNEQSIQKHKTWLVRLLASLAGISVLPTILGIILGIADRF